MLSHESGWESVGADGGKSEEKVPEMRPSEPALPFSMTLRGEV